MNAAAPSEPIPFRTLLDDAMKFTRRHIATIYLPLAIPLAVLAALQTVVQLRYMSTMMQGGAAGAPFVGAGCATFLGTLLLSLAVHGLASAVAAAAAVDAASGRPVAVGSRWAFIFRPDVLITLVVALLAVFIGFCLLLFPGVYIGLRLAFLIPVMAAEGLSGGEAMKRSWALVRYNPHKRFIDNTASKIFLLYLVAGLISYAVGFLVQFPLAAIQGIRLARNVSAGRAGLVSPDYWLQIPSAVLSSLVSTVITIYTAFGIVLLYMDTVRRKEGTDLAAAIDARFGAGPMPPPPSGGTAPA